MNKSTAWRWGGWSPIILLFVGYIIYLISLKDWIGFFWFIVIVGVLYLSFWWGKYCAKKEFEAKREEEGEPESHY